MPRTADLQSNFTAGELSARLFGRTDLGKYKNGVALMENAMVLTHGGAMRRSGFRHVVEVKDSTKATRLQEYEFSQTQAYTLEFGNLYIRFLRDRGQITSSATVSGCANNGSGLVRVTATAHGFQSLNTVTIAGVVGTTEANGTHVITVIDANNFDLVGSSFSNSYTSGGTAVAIVEIATPYLEADLFDLRFTQSADVLYCAHSSYEPRKLSRTSHTAWTIEEIAFQDGPYLEVNTSATTITLSGTTGSVTVTASAITGINSNAGFKSTDVDRLIRWKDPAGNWTWLKITAFTDTTNVTATISGPDASAGTATVDWRLGAWSETTGFPSLVTFFEDRLGWFANTNQPQTTWLSKSGDYENMAPTDADGTVADDHSITYTLATDQLNKINWVSSGKRLCIGTAGGEFTVGAGSSTEALTPSNIQVLRETTHGSAFIEPQRVGPAVLFVTRHKKKVHEFIYKFEVDQFQAPEMTLLGEHIAQKKIKETAFMRDPVSVYWACLENGHLIGMTYMRDQEVVGWHRHPIGGSFDVDAFAHCESVSVIPGDGQDELWCVNKRTINGATKRYIEYMENEFRPDDVNDKDDCFFVDSGATLDSPLTITGATRADPVVVSVTNSLSDGDRVKISKVKGMTELNGLSFYAVAVSGSAVTLIKDYDAIGITGATRANPVSIASAAHGLSTGDKIGILAVTGMTNINGRIFTITKVDADNFTLDGEDGTSHSTYVSGGSCYEAIDGSAYTAYASAGELREMVTAVSGLTHLEGETVQVLGDGAVQPDKTVSSGAITIDYAAAVVQVGLQYNTQIRTLRPEAGSAEGTSQGKAKRIFEAIYRFNDTLGAKFGSDVDDLDEILFRSGSDPMDASPPLFSGDKVEAFPGDWDADGQQYIEQSQPLPLTLLSVVSRMLVSDG